MELLSSSISVKDKPMDNTKVYSALIISKDKQTFDLLRGMLKIINVESFYAEDNSTAEKLLSSRLFDVLIINYVLDDGSSDDLKSMLSKSNFRNPTVMLFSDPEMPRLPSLLAGANSILTRPFSDAEFLMITRNLLNVSEVYDRLEYAEQVIQALVASIEARDHYTSGHSVRVSNLSIKMYDALGFNDKDERENLRIGGLLHDIGKIGVPDTILKSPNPLSEDDIYLIQKHPSVGYDICKPLDKLEGSIPVIIEHHERLDGSGYPYGLKSGEISMIAQIAMIPDIYDALTTQRSYRGAMSHAQAIKILDEESADGRINEAYLQALKNIDVE